MIPHVYSTKKEEESESAYNHENTKITKWYDHVLLNRPAKIIAALLLCGIVGPLLIYRYFFFATMDRPPADGFSTGSCLLPREARLPCGVGNTTASNCHSQCCYDEANNLCFHRLPSRFSYIVDREWNEDVILQPRIPTVPYNSQRSVRNLKLSVDEHSPTHLTLTFYDAQDNTITGKRNENKTYSYIVMSPELNVVVNSTQGTVFNMARGPLIASDNIWEITFKLTNETMFGLGELPLKLGMTKVLFNHDNGLNGIPLIFAKSNGSFHGLLIDESSPTEVSIRGNNHIVVRSITNNSLKLHLFMGPTPKDVMKDAMEMLGSKMKLEYWMLGIHICSETTPTLSGGLDNLRVFISNATRDGLPYDSHCGTGPVVFNADECEGTERDAIRRGIDLVRQAGKRYVPHVSPYIRYNRNYSLANDSNKETASNDTCYNIVSNNTELFYRCPLTLEIYQGLVGDDKVLYPSYDNASVEFMKGLWGFDVTLNGVVLENSWPLDQGNKTHNITAANLPYFNENFALAFNNTPPWDLRLLYNDQKFLQRHNKYGNDFAKAFRTMFEENIPTWSSSQWMNGEMAINRQNIDALWSNLHKELIEAALGGISGHWLWLSPICGDTEKFDNVTQVSLCIKWYMAGTYFPMLKIHSKVIPRTPLAFVGTHRHLMLEALRRRISFLPYLFTTLQEGPLLRPMFYQYPDVGNLTTINTQFSVGDDLVIVPNLQPLQSFVHLWLPPGTWYEFWGGLKLDGEVGEAVTMSTTEADFLTVIRAGSILITQRDTRLTAVETRLRSSLSLTIALDCKDNGTACNATGKLFVAENTTIIFEATEENLVISMYGDMSLLCDRNKAVLSEAIENVWVFGLREEFNNYDHHLHRQAWLYLCDYQDQVEFPLT